MSENKQKGGDGFEVLEPDANQSDVEAQLKAAKSATAEAEARAEAAEANAAEANARADEAVASKGAAGKAGSKKGRTKGGKIKCVTHALHHPYLGIRIPTTYAVPIEKWDNWVQVQVDAGLIVEEK